MFIIVYYLCENKNMESVKLYNFVFVFTFFYRHNCAKNIQIKRSHWNSQVKFDFIWLKIDIYKFINIQRQDNFHNIIKTNPLYWFILVVFTVSGHSDVLRKTWAKTSYDRKKYDYIYFLFIWKINKWINFMSYWNLNNLKW